MKSVIVVREYARITTERVEPSLYQAQVSATAFDWLCNLQAGFSKAGASLLQVENRRWLKLDSYVGVLQTPCGTVIEVLPKVTEDVNETAASDSRKLLIKMLKSALDLPVRTADKADIELFKHPLLEWVMKEFTHALDHLIKRGLRFDYQRIEEEQRFLRGQLNINKQLRQPPGREHIFNIRHDLFLPDRPENRLLKTALMRVCKLTQQPTTWRLAHELAGILAEVPVSKSIQDDFRQWRNDRLMAHYQPVRPWCELVLGQQMPLAMQGSTSGISLLFPMEKLFETFVEKKLHKLIPPPYRLKSQAASKSLCEHDNGQMFQLRPDLLVIQGNSICAVLDTKWKLINSANKSDKYGLSQSDFYQLFAYGHKYLHGVKGQMMLIYPKTAAFTKPLPVFDYGNDLRLWVVPFDLKEETLEWPAGWLEPIGQSLNKSA
ncbi:MAG: restriction endonuclease [Cellvibrio sp.]|nr:restriction endonuclease [Cellvibrio sp.]